MAEHLENLEYLEYLENLENLEYLEYLENPKHLVNTIELAAAGCVETRKPQASVETRLRSDR